MVRFFSENWPMVAVAVIAILAAAGAADVLHKKSVEEKVGIANTLR